MLGISFFGTLSFLVPAGILVAFLLARRRGFRAMLFFGAAGLGAWGLNTAVKLACARQRPRLWESVSPEQDFSFPSGHAMTTMAIALALVYLTPPRQRGWAALAAALIVVPIGVSRVYLGVHYPTDVLGGWCFGAALVPALAATLKPAAAGGA
jgi:undecaprenyl-diphosphatase